MKGAAEALLRELRGGPAAPAAPVARAAAVGSSPGGRVGLLLHSQAALSGVVDGALLAVWSPLCHTSWTVGGAATKTPPVQPPQEAEGVSRPEPLLWVHSV